jgi:hypothetical protein
MIAECNENAGPMLERLADKDNFHNIIDNACENSNAITYDYKAIVQANQWIKKEIIEYVFCPNYVEKWVKETNRPVEEYSPSYIFFEAVKHL